MTRKIAPSEEELHHETMGRHVTEGAVKGLAGGALIGAAMRASGGTPKMPRYAWGGTALGALVGAGKGREARLKDKVREERLHQRAEARTKKSSDAVMEAFYGELTKEAVLPALAGLAARATPLLARIGGGVVKGLGSAAKAVGPRVGAPNLGQGFSNLVSRGVQASGGQQQFMRNVGIGAVGLGAAGVAGAGAMAARR